MNQCFVSEESQVTVLNNNDYRDRKIKAKTNVSFSSIFPLNLSMPSSQIEMQRKIINARKALKLLSSDFNSFTIFSDIVIGECADFGWDRVNFLQSS